MLSFTSQNDNFFFPVGLVHSKKQTRVTANQHTLKSCLKASICVIIIIAILAFFMNLLSCSISIVFLAYHNLCSSSSLITTLLWSILNNSIIPLLLLNSFDAVTNSPAPHKKTKLLLGIYLLNATKSELCCRFGHIY